MHWPLKERYIKSFQIKCICIRVREEFCPTKDIPSYSLFNPIGMY